MLGVYLSENLEVNSYDVISVGGEDVALMIPQEVFNRAIVTRSWTFIIIHNHPSGDPTPSSDDKMAMEALKTYSKDLNRTFLDFIIVGEDKYWSMFEEMDGGDYSLGIIN